MLFINVHKSTFCLRAHSGSPHSVKRSPIFTLLYTPSFFACSCSRYKRNGGKYWKNFVSTKGEEWEKMNLEWFTSFSPENRLVVFYDQLVQETMAVLQTVLDFLQVSVPGSTLQCVMDRREGIFKRSKKKLGIEVFTSPMKTFLMEKQAKVFNILLNNSTANGTNRN